MLYILTTVWVLRTPNAGGNSHFQRPFCKKTFFSFFAEKPQKMTISTSVWSAQNPNAGRNLQQAPLAISLTFTG